ncbi:MAG TPA: hypothetical protein VF409_14110 [Sphingomonas sp.]
MTLLERIRSMFAGNRGHQDGPDMARIREMLDYLKDNAYVPPPGGATR